MGDKNPNKKLKKKKTVEKAAIAQPIIAAVTDFGKKPKK
jgi:hypothetical protein